MKEPDLKALHEKDQAAAAKDDADVRRRFALIEYDLQKWIPRLFRWYGIPFWPRAILRALIRSALFYFAARGILSLIIHGPFVS